MEPHVGDVNPQNPAETWQHATCDRGACPWMKVGFLPTDAADRAAALDADPDVQAHRAAAHPELPHLAEALADVPSAPTKPPVED